MSNLFVNRLSAVLSDADMARIMAGIADAAQTMPFLVGLNDEERRRMPMIRRENKLFVEEAVRALEQNQTLLPGYMNPLEMGRDLRLHDDLLEVELQLGQLFERVRHTRMLAGAEAFQAALVFYKMAKAAAEAGVPGTHVVVDKLRERFKGQGPTGNGTPDTPTLDPDEFMASLDA